jgi:diadenylate cyclase
MSRFDARRFDARGAGYHAEVVVRPSSAMADALALVAPGQPLRDGIERVLQANRGLLLVVGDGPEVLSICTGGFLLDAEFSPQRLSELAKMDGAVILSPDADRIARANVHLMPNATIPTIETGTRHRTAERVARSIDVPVVSVSAAMGLVTVYRRDTRHVLQDERRLHERVRQALQTTRRFRERFDSTLSSLSALEIADTVTMRDVAAVLQPAGLLIRIAEEVKVDLVELGEDGRLLRLQLEEVLDGIDPVRRLVVRDYLHCEDGRHPGRDGARAPGRAPSRSPAARGDGQGPGAHGEGHGVTVDESVPTLDALSGLSTDDLLDVRRVSSVLGLGDPDAPVEPRGYRLLHRLPRFPETLVDRIVDHFAGLQRIMRTSVAELEEVEGVGEARARSVKEGLARLAEASILDRYS